MLSLSFFVSLFEREGEREGETNENLISVVESNEIFSLPFGGKDTPDRLICPFTKNGSYSVKSGYHWIIGNIKRA